MAIPKSITASFRPWLSLLLIATTTIALLLRIPLSSAAESAVVIPPPKQDVPASEARIEKAVFAGGCFWGVQGVFQHVKGVTGAVSGYAGGDQATADYSTVSGGQSGHAE